MSSAQERAADIAHDAMDGEGWNAMTIADALHAANLLVDDDTARLVALGRAVEQSEYLEPRPGDPYVHGWNRRLAAIYEAAGVEP